MRNNKRKTDTNAVTKPLRLFTNGILSLFLLQGCAEEHETPKTVQQAVSEEMDPVVANGAHALTSVTSDEALAVITTNALANGSLLMPAYVAQKRRSRPVYVVTENRTLIADGVTVNTGWAQGVDLTAPPSAENSDARAEAIRTWLLNNYVSLNIKHLLLIGNPNPVGGDVPMKATYPYKHFEELADGRDFFMDMVKHFCSQWVDGADPSCNVCVPADDPSCMACDPETDPDCRICESDTDVGCKLCDPTIGDGTDDDTDDDCEPCNPATGANCTVCTHVVYDDCLVWIDQHDPSRSTPTDYYYSNLNSVWPVDAEGDITVHIEVDFSHQDINVGRVPVYGNDIVSLDKILNKFIVYAADTDTAWRKNALLAMDAHGLDNGEPVSGHYAPLGEAAVNNILIPNGFDSYRIYETYSPPGCTTPDCAVSGDLNSVNITNVGSVWAGPSWSGCSGEGCMDPKQDFGVVFWATHGSPTGSTDVITVNNSASDYTAELDDLHPAFTISLSCSNSDPSTEGNVGATLLDNGSIAFLGATVVSWPGAPYADWADPYIRNSSSIDVAYGFLLELIDHNFTGGEALSAVRTHLWNEVLSSLPTPTMPAVDASESEWNTWWWYWDQKNAWKRQLLLFNLYGDPTIGIGVDETDGVCVSDADCNDDDACTEDTCNPITGICEFTPGNDVYQAETMYHSTGNAYPEGWNIYNNGYVAFNRIFNGGTQTMTVRAAGSRANGVWPVMRVTVNGAQVYNGTVNSASWNDYSFTFAAPVGNAEVRIYFTNDFYGGSFNDRNLYIDRATTECILNDSASTLNLGPVNNQTTFTVDGAQRLVIDQLTFNGWTPAKIVVGIGHTDNQTLNGTFISINGGAPIALVGDWRQIEIPFTGQSTINLTITSATSRALRAQWWATN